MCDAGGTDVVTRLVGVSLNAAIDKTTSVERLVPGGIHRPRVLSVLPGGKAVNVVRAAARLGLPGEVVAVVGGHAGAWFREALAGDGIGARLVEAGGETRTCLSVLDESTGRLTEFYEAGITVPERAWGQVEAALGASLRTDAPGAIVVLAGSLPPGVPIDGYARLARIVTAAGARAVIDVGGEPLTAALREAPWLVKVNADEAATVTGLPTGRRAGTEAAARAMLGAGAGNVIVTRGLRGAVLATSGGSWSLGPVPASRRGAFSVGSGDAFLAGFVAGLAAGQTLQAALRRAGAAGTANALTPGQGVLDPSVVRAILPECRVIRLRSSSQATDRRQRRTC